MQNANNVIEHLFNVSTNCDKSWCYAKHAEEEDKNYIANEDHQCYCKKY